jgi:hypothetical protein
MKRVPIVEIVQIHRIFRRRRIIGKDLVPNILIQIVTTARCRLSSIKGGHGGLERK